MTRGVVTVPKSGKGSFDGMSQDPVAIDSVGYDFLRSEFGSRLATDAKNNGNKFAMDAYLREAALANNPPSGTVYQPDGTRLASLGTHEHWNNATAMQYSRNAMAHPTRTSTQSGVLG